MSAAERYRSGWKKNCDLPIYLSFLTLPKAVFFLLMTFITVNYSAHGALNSKRLTRNS